jgi:Flp pilus assembly protein TadG
MVLSSVASHIRRMRVDERGSVATIMGFLLIPLVGALGLGFEVSNWYMTTRNMQNAADSAVIAAATNAGANYDVEAKAVAAAYGFVNGINNVTVAVANTATCPDGTNTCYSVSISGFVPLLLSQVVGFRGDTNASGTLEKKLSSASVAKASTQLCILALASSGAAQGIRTNGAPTADLSGCNVMSNTAAQCNGSNLNAGIGLAHGTSSGCGVKQVSNVPVRQDPYAFIANSPNFPNIGASGCGPATDPKNFPHETAGHGSNHATTTVLANQLQGTLALTAGYNYRCGDVVLTNNVTVTGNPAVLVIENGQLDLNGFTLTTANGAGVTVFFQGNNGTTYTHAPTDTFGGGKLDLAAPTSGLFKGVAIYQDPGITFGSGLDVAAAGNSPTWDITGLVYMPNASITLKGAIDKATNGHKCFALVADNVTLSGNAGIAKTDTGECSSAGLTMPDAKAGVALVL